MRTHPPLRRLVACILLPCCLLACSTWKTQEASPQQVLADEQPAKVRVTLTDGSQVVLEQPVVSGDTLTGLREGEQVSISLASVSELELRKGDTVKTIALTTGIVVGVAAVAFGVGLLIYCSGPGDDC
jgi:hypothetical protein